MTFARDPLIRDFETIPRIPSWVTSGRVETLEGVAFLSGAALAHLHVVLGQADVPHSLLRERLALCAAEACVAYSGRPEGARELRDAVHLLRPGDLPGPAGETYLVWRRAVELAGFDQGTQPVSYRVWMRRGSRVGSTWGKAGR